MAGPRQFKAELFSACAVLNKAPEPSQILQARQHLSQQGVRGDRHRPPYARRRVLELRAQSQAGNQVECVWDAEILERGIGLAKSVTEHLFATHVGCHGVRFGGYHDSLPTDECKIMATYSTNEFRSRHESDAGRRSLQHFGKRVRCRPSSTV